MRGTIAGDQPCPAGLVAAPGELFQIDEQVLGRTARPEEIAAAVRFLVGPGAPFVNGSAFVVDGGLLAELAI